MPTRELWQENLLLEPNDTITIIGESINEYSEDSVNFPQEKENSPPPAVPSTSGLQQNQAGMSESENSITPSTFENSATPSTFRSKQQ